MLRRSTRREWGILDPHHSIRGQAVDEAVLEGDRPRREPLRLSTTLPPFGSDRQQGDLQSAGGGRYQGYQPPARRKKKNRLMIDDETACKIQTRLRHATSGTTAARSLPPDPMHAEPSGTANIDERRYFGKFDKDKGGTLNETEFRRVLRDGMRVSELEITDDEITLLVSALDDDGGGELSIKEISDFIEQGTATFSAGPPPLSVIQVLR